MWAPMGIVNIVDGPVNLSSSLSSAWALIEVFGIIGSPAKTIKLSSNDIRIETIIP